MKAFVGRVWPGHTVFPDFLNPLTTEYWTSQVCNASNILATLPIVQ